jgi:hypothetical protein
VKKKYLRWLFLIVFSPIIAFALLAAAICMLPIVLGYWLFGSDELTLREAIDDVLSMPAPR